MSVWRTAAWREFQQGVYGHVKPKLITFGHNIKGFALLHGGKAPRDTESQVADQVRPMPLRAIGGQVNHPLNRLGVGTLDGHDLCSPRPPQVGSMISSDVSRYPWQMMRGLAPAIAMRARPALEVPTPGKTVPLEETPYQSDPRGTGQSEQGSPSTSGTPRKAPPSHSTPNTQDTHNGEKVIQVPLALSAEGSPSAPKTPQRGMIRSPPASPEKHRASKGLRALSLLTSGIQGKPTN